MSYPGVMHSYQEVVVNQSTAMLSFWLVIGSCFILGAFMASLDKKKRKTSIITGIIGGLCMTVGVYLYFDNWHRETQWITEIEEMYVNNLPSATLSLLDVDIDEYGNNVIVYRDHNTNKIVTKTFYKGSELHMTLESGEDPVLEAVLLKEDIPNFDFDRFYNPKIFVPKDYQF